MLENTKITWKCINLLEKIKNVVKTTFSYKNITLIFWQFLQKVDVVKSASVVQAIVQRSCTIVQAPPPGSFFTFSLKKWKCAKKAHNSTNTSKIMKIFRKSVFSNKKRTKLIKINGKQQNHSKSIKSIKFTQNRLKQHKTAKQRVKNSKKQKKHQNIANPTESI